MRSLNLAAVVLVCSMLIGGCSTFAARGFLHAERGTAARSSAAGLRRRRSRIVIDAVTVPELVDRPQFVLRTGATQVTIDEFARWADPLQSQISRVLAADLAQARAGRAGVGLCAASGQCAGVSRVGRRAELRIRAGRDGERSRCCGRCGRRSGRGGHRPHDRA